MSNEFEPFPKLFKIFGLFISDFEVHRFDGLNEISSFLDEFIFFDRS